MLSCNQQAFFALVRAGLWENEARLSAFTGFDYAEVYRLAEEQHVLGLMAAGLEHVADVEVPEDVTLTLLGRALPLEHQNTALNVFVGILIRKLHAEGIDALLVKGQGIAQCYQRPLWRSWGDIDLLLDDENYEKAKRLLLPLADSVETEYTYFKHVGLTLRGWIVELHGTLQSRLSKRVDDEIDRVQACVFENRKVRTWQNGETEVLLPAPDEDVIFVFTHIMHHFFFEGVGLRQLCDWCRLLWTYRDSLDRDLLESRIRRMGLMTEWKAFAAFAIEYLGMPVEVMPLYDVSDKKDERRWKRKADHICKFVLEVGNFGENHGRDLSGLPYLVRKTRSLCYRLKDMLRHSVVFPKDSIVFFGGVLRSGLYAAVRGE